MSISEFYIQPFSAVNTDGVDIRRFFPASVWGIAAGEAALSFVRLFRFFYDFSEITRPVLMNVRGGGKSLHIL
jgi:hypothetical protein